jgi:type I restriction enzyme M protein
VLHRRLIENVEQVKEVAENDIISAEIFCRTEGLPLLDKYAAYQILADNWAGIMGDVEIIQTEGLEACKAVESRTKLVKDKNGVEQEVEDGLKGRIITFELMQKTRFTNELDSIVDLQNRIEAIDGEVEAIREELLGMEDTDKYFDTEKENAFVKKEITTDSKPKADVEDDVKEDYRQIIIDTINETHGTKFIDRTFTEPVATCSTPFEQAYNYRMKLGVNATVEKDELIYTVNGDDTGYDYIEPPTVRPDYGV